MGVMPMGTGRSGIYYTSHGSSAIHHEGIIHSYEGVYKQKADGSLKLEKGGHGQGAIDFMDKNGIKYEINKTFSNGVRVGNVRDAEQNFRKTGNRHSWFPANWTDKTIVAASNYITSLKKNAGYKSGDKIYGTYKHVKIVAYIGKDGSISTIFPDANDQPN